MPSTQRASKRTRRSSKAKPDHGIGKFLSMPWWAGISAIAAVLAIAGTVAAVLAILPSDQHDTQSASHSSTSSPLLSEEHMVSLLIPGDTYARLQQIIGPEPDMQQTFKSGDTLYQFNRPWEFIDLLVRAGRVLSVGVYAKTTAFKATLDASGYKVTINGPAVGQQADYVTALGAVGNCGGNIGASLFVGFMLPMANQESSYVLGWVQSRWLDIPQAACAAVFPLNKCDKLDSFAGLSPRFLDCVNSSKIGQEIKQLSPSVAMVTAPGQSILPEMLDYGPLSIGPGLILGSLHPAYSVIREVISGSGFNGR
jgi:hypothetical protein